VKLVKETQILVRQLEMNSVYYHMPFGCLSRFVNWNLDSRKILNTMSFEAITRHHAA
jgi:hypothetical protein